MTKDAIGHVVLAGAVALVACAGIATTAQAADAYFKLSSPDFKDGGVLPRKAAGSTAGNANCVGQNISPAFKWVNPPAGTKSFALLMLDPEARGAKGVSHWVAYGIPVSVTGFAQGEVSKPSDKYVGGKSLMGVGTYSGPCTPPGDWHHYTFMLIATDLDPKALQPGLTREELLAAVDGHTKGTAGLIGRFTKPEK